MDSCATDLFARNNPRTATKRITSFCTAIAPTVFRRARRARQVLWSKQCIDRISMCRPTPTRPFAHREGAMVFLHLFTHSALILFFELIGAWGSSKVARGYGDESGWRLGSRQWGCIYSSVSLLCQKKVRRPNEAITLD